MHCARKPPNASHEEAKAKYIGDLTKEASKEYDKILTRYPMMDRADDANKRLTALHQPVPRPTKAAVAQNKAEIASRSEASLTKRMMGLIKKGPDVAKAAKVGEPTLVEPEPIAATRVIREKHLARLG